jgi:O-antigen ligase
VSVRLENAIFITLLLIVVFSATAHGIVEPWSLLVFEFLTLALTLMWAAKAFVTQRLTLEIPQIIWPITMLFVIGLVQSISWQDSLNRRQSLSFDVEATSRTTIMLGILIVLSLIAANTLTSPNLLLRFLKVMIGFGAALSVFGLFQHFSGSRQIYWLRPAEAAPFGPFFNRNHFAGYLELILPLPLAFIATGYVRGEKLALYGAAAVFMGTAIIFTLSRAGMISVFVELIFLAVIGYRRSRISNLARGNRRTQMLKAAFISLALLASILAGVLWFGVEPVINRIATGDPNNSDMRQSQSFYSNRGEIWNDSLSMIRDNFHLGVGLGAYPTAYPLYTKNPFTAGVIAEAHNDYLQIMTDAGLIGGFLAIWFLLILFRAIARGLRNDNPSTAAIVIGGGAGAAGLLTHSIFDYNLHLPSHALLFLVFSTMITRLAVAENPVRERSIDHSRFSGPTREIFS